MFLCVYKHIVAAFIIVFVTILVKTINYCLRGRVWCEDHLVSLKYCLSLISVKVKNGKLRLLRLYCTIKKYIKTAFRDIKLCRKAVSKLCCHEIYQ